MEYCIDQSIFDSNFLNSKGEFSHKTNMRYNLFPFTGSTSDKSLDSFDNILGAFIRNIYSLDTPEDINRDSIISEISKDIDFDGNPANEEAFRKMIKDIYFADENHLKHIGLSTYKYTASSKNDNKISEYMVSALCNKEKIRKALSDKSDLSGNLMDNLIESHLPKMKEKKDAKNYIPLMPEIAELFTKDLIFLINDNSLDVLSVIQLISYYYFFYTSQVILNLNRFCKGNMNIIPVYFCMNWEKTSKNRACQKQGWHQIDTKLSTMFSHAVLLEMLNQTTADRKFSYIDIYNLYRDLSEADKNAVFSEIEQIKNNYRTQYAEPDGFAYKLSDYASGDIEGLLREFFDDIMYQFEMTSRSRANDAYCKSFYDFCRNNFLQNRKRNGLMLVLGDEQLVLLTKVIIGKENQLRLNKLFDEFEKRGIYMDKDTRECVVEFYEKLNLIEKKSDSGDAQYVKGIL